MWPVQPTPSRFAVQGDGEARSIDPDNGARYTPFVLFVEAVDTKKAAAVYARLYPLFQQAYEELGYPGKHALAIHRGDGTFSVNLDIDLS